jgi:hypothetical protein
MKKKGLADWAEEIACGVIDAGEVEDEEDVDWWLATLGAAVASEADERGLENATEIAEEAVRLYRKKRAG